MTPLQTALLPTPVGPLAVVVDPDDGAVVASGFRDLADQQGRLAPDLQARGFQAGGAAVDVVADAVAAYNDGGLDALEKVAVRQPGGPFLQEAWRALRAVRAGSTATYAELATRAGRPQAVRAAGSACARNMVAPFVPCHRILRSDGTLGGYYYGLDVKAALLAHEGVTVAQPALFT